MDGDVLYVDHNGNGDLTEPSKKIAITKNPGTNPEEDGFYFEVRDLLVGGRKHRNLLVSFTPLKRYSQTNAGKYEAVKAAFARDPKALVVYISLCVELPGLKGGEAEDRVDFRAGWLDSTGVFQFADSPAKAPAVWYGGPFQITFYDTAPTLQVGREREVNLCVGSLGIGPGTIAKIGYEGTITPKIKPVVEVSYATMQPGGAPIKERFEIKDRCCTVNFFGPAKVQENAKAGTATITLSFDAWTGAKVAPSTHTVTLLPARTRPKDEPVAKNLIASLANSDRKASVTRVMFSPDGTKLFSSGYPSGIVQIWDVASKKQISQILTPSGYRGTDEYALLDADWKTLYVPIEKRTTTRIDIDGKKAYRFDYSGEIRVWDLASGKMIEPLRPEPGYGTQAAFLSPSKSILISIERPADTSVDREVKGVMFVWDLKSLKKRKLADGFDFPSFGPDGETVDLIFTDYSLKKSSLRRLDLATGRELAKLNFPVSDRVFSSSTYSPDGKLLAVPLGGKRVRPWRPGSLMPKHSWSKANWSPRGIPNDTAGVQDISLLTVRRISFSTGSEM